MERNNKRIRDISHGGCCLKIILTDCQLTAKNREDSRFLFGQDFTARSHAISMKKLSLIAFISPSIDMHSSG